MLEKIDEKVIINYAKNAKNVIDSAKADINPYYKESDPLHVDLYWSTNLHSIFDKIIASVGRYCDNWGSDFLYTRDRLIETLRRNDFKDDSDDVYIFAIRRSGVDGTCFLATRVNDDPRLLDNDYYRAIYAIVITHTTNNITDEPELIIELKDLSGMSIYSLK